MAGYPTSPAISAAPRSLRVSAAFLDFLLWIFAQRFGAYLGGVVAAVIMTARSAPAWVIEQEIERGIRFGATFWGLSFLAVNYGVLQGIWGGSAGKLLCGLRVLHVSGSPIGVGRSLLRTGSYFFSAMPMYAGFVMALWDKKVRTLHDRVSGTWVARESHSVERLASIVVLPLHAPKPISVQPLHSTGDSVPFSRDAA